MTQEQTPPTLSFQLLGNWSRLDLVNEESLAQSVRDYVRDWLGGADADAKARSLLRARLTQALTTAREAGGSAAFLATEITPGTPMPVMLTIYSPRDLRMTPAIGSDPEVVATMLRTGLERLGVEGVETAVSMGIDGSAILRIVREQVEPVHPDVPDQQLTNLVADYWYTVPGTKQVVLANFATPLADIPEIMLSFFDATVRASYFTAPALSASA
ncbi:MAG: hypothetical protein ABI632_08190 [Pseudolysinimonas sp.]